MRLIHPILLILCGCFFTLFFSQTSLFAQSKNQFYSDNPILATIANESITIHDLEDRELNQLRTELYKRLQQRLLIKTIEKLAQNHPEYAVIPQFQVSDKQISDFYYENKLQSRGTLSSLGPRIRTLLESQAQIEYLESLFVKAKTEGLITTYLTEPEPFLLKVPIETAFLRGNENAKVMMLEFSDYQCPFCSRVQSTINELQSIYEGKVVFAYRHSPLPFHKEADEAAIAVECAREQGNFEELHMILFDNFRNITINKLPSFAKEAGVKNATQFNTCLETEKYRPRLENDQRAAATAGINGTPGFIIGLYDKTNGVVKGELLSGALPKQQFADMIDKYLKQ